MNKKSNSKNNLIPLNTADVNNNQSSGSLTDETSGAKKKMQENSLHLRLAEMEEINAFLMNRVNEDTKILDEVIANNAKFLSILAHDLRNPFNSIIGVLEILGDNSNDFNKAELENLIRMASSSANNTLKLLEDLLAWSISQNKEQTINPVKIDLHEIVTGEFESFGIAAAQKHITLEHSIAPEFYLTADLHMVKLIVRNLISNAIKFSNTGGVIFISATLKKQFVEIAFRDNGIGMSQNAIEKLFKADEFNSTAGTNNELGTGLGLLFCKEFIEIHGGKIWVASEPGKGSVFRFTLPHYI
jgi:signal transduction histidine kinase